ncbi:hypothetical protein [Vibrio vulnificus]|uniref:hypothetical protein n=1 Tax=Vibrio vulnificus TaxID=672 RepID=UPI001CDC093B|nr:hypothetical protein [Vibrio vulnificus]MCA3966841.1 hypothetical protein [Vibrio vulnificus]
MHLAHRAVLPTAKSLKTHRQQHPAPYERVLEREGQWWRYYSQQPATLYGEYLSSLLPFPPPEEKAIKVVYIEHIDHDLWYMASFEPLLTQEAVGTLASLTHTLGYALYHASHIWVTDAKAYTHIDQDSRCSLIPSVDKSTLIEFELDRKPSSRKVPLILAAAALLSLSFITWQMQPPSSPPKPLQPVDQAKLNYEQRWSNQVNAYDALLSSRNLLLQAAMMPPGLSGHSVTFGQHSLILSVTKDRISAPLESTWLESHPMLANYYQPIDAHFATITLPLPSLPTWKSHDVNGYRSSLMIGLQRLGANITEQHRQEIGGTQITTLLVEFPQASVGQIGVIAELLKPPFVSLSELEMEINPQHQLPRLSFTLDVQGE